VGRRFGGRLDPASHTRFVNGSVAPATIRRFLLRPMRRVGRSGWVAASTGQGVKSSGSDNREGRKFCAKVWRYTGAPVSEMQRFERARRATNSGGPVPTVA
jgi:hypothetical protein